VSVLALERAVSTGFRKERTNRMFGMICDQNGIVMHCARVLPPPQRRVGELLADQRGRLLA
jgi:hypothetical protein